MTLKPCPFCGEFRTKVRNNHALKYSYVFCEACSATGPIAEHAALSTQQWNDRDEDNRVHLPKIREDACRGA